MDFPATGGISGGSLKALFDVRDGNNKENMTGVVDSVETVDGQTSINMTYPSVTDINALTLPEKGRITINSKHYYYDSWEATITDGQITGVKFNLTEELTESEADRLEDLTVTCGETVDAMGVPYYQAQINEFLRNFAQAFNDIEKQGVDLYGNTMGAFFVGTSATGVSFDANDWDEGIATGTTFTIGSNDDSYYQITSVTLGVNETSLKDPNYFSTASEITNGVAKYDIVEKLMTLQNGVTMFRGDTAESFLETLLSDITVDVNKTEISSNNYTNLATVISTQRTSVSGVDEDEEALNLIKFQNAYNLASKVISVMAEMYDKLINETGVT
jgi:flagellar hook-associated protein 1 FlgK